MKKNHIKNHIKNKEEINMKKTLVILIGAVFALAVYWFGFYMGISNVEDTPIVEEEKNIVFVPSDEDIMNRIILEEHGPEYYGILTDDNNDEWIDYIIYSSDGEIKYYSQSNRVAYRQRYIVYN